MPEGQALGQGGEPLFCPGPLDIYNMNHGPHKIINLKTGLLWLVKHLVTSPQCSGRARPNDVAALVRPVDQKFPSLLGPVPQASMQAQEGGLAQKPDWHWLVPHVRTF